MRRTLLFASIAAVLRCGDGGAPQTSSPVTPFYMMGDSRVDTASEKALDANGAVYTRNCSNAQCDWMVRGAATAEQRQDVVAGFSQLPATSDPSCSVRSVAKPFLWLRYVTDEATQQWQEWAVCTDAQSNPAPPYAVAWSSLSSL
jgi:hypothetical protein